MLSMRRSSKTDFFAYLRPVGVLYSRSNIAADLFCKIRIGVRETKQEFFAAVPGDDIGLAAPVCEYLGNSAKNLVADGVREAVVDLLEMIDVGKRNREVAIVAPCAFNLALQIIVRVATVKQTC